MLRRRLDCMLTWPSQVQGNTGTITPPAPPLVQQVPSAKSLARLEGRIRELFTTWTIKAYGSADTVLACDLPDLLSAYEAQRGLTLITPEGLPGLQNFVDTYPDQKLDLNEFVLMVASLQQTLPPTGDEGDTSASSEADTSTSNDEDDSQDYSSDEPTSPSPRRVLQPRTSSPPPAKGSGTTTPSLARSPREAPIDMPSTPPATANGDTKMARPKPHPFPSSRSAHFEDEGAVEGEDGPRLPSNLQHKRQIATSDPAESPHRRASAPAPQSRNKPRTRERRISDRRVSDEAGEEKVVLSGKGRAKVPPSSWTRPKPTALAARGRRTSDASASACSAEGSADGSNGPLSARPSHQRMPSNPDTQQSGSPPPLPRSSSHGFNFPRTSQERPQVSTDEWAAEQERYAAEVGDTTELARGSSSRGGSPGVVEEAYQRFGAMSPPPPLAGGFTSRPSSAAGRRLSTTGGYGMQREDSGDWKERYEAAHLRHLEKERKFQSETQKQEDHIVDLTNNFERVEADLAQKRKDLIEQKAREARANDRLTQLEAELAIKVQALTGIETRYESLTQQVTEYHRELLK